MPSQNLPYWDEIEEELNKKLEAKWLNTQFQTLDHSPFLTADFRTTDQQTLLDQINRAGHKSIHEHGVAMDFTGSAGYTEDDLDRAWHEGHDQGYTEGYADGQEEA